MRQKRQQDCWQTKYANTTMVDTIICLNGCEVIGAYLAQELSRSGIRCMNAHETIYVTAPEQDINGQMIFRDNTKADGAGKERIDPVHLHHDWCDT